MTASGGFGETSLMLLMLIEFTCGQWRDQSSIPESLSTYEFSAYLNVHMTGPGECTVVLLNTSIYNTPGFNRV